MFDLDISKIPPQPIALPESKWESVDWFDRPLLTFRSGGVWAIEMRTRQWVPSYQANWASKSAIAEWLGISPLRLKHAIGRFAYGKRYSKRGKKSFDDRLWSSRAIEGQDCVRVSQAGLAALVEDQYDRYPLPAQPKPADLRFARNR